MKPALNIWTVYYDPYDFPGQYVARRFEVAVGTSKATTDHRVSDSISGVHAWVAKQAAARGTVPHRIERDPSDDPKIVESWL